MTLDRLKGSANIASMLLSDRTFCRFFAGIYIGGLFFMCLSGHGYAAEGTAGTIVAETGDIGIVVERANVRNGENLPMRLLREIH
jgi:hypothetical protein